MSRSVVRNLQLSPWRRWRSHPYPSVSSTIYAIVFLLTRPTKIRYMDRRFHDVTNVAAVANHYYYYYYYYLFCLHKFARPLYTYFILYRYNIILLWNRIGAVVVPGGSRTPTTNKFFRIKSSAPIVSPPSPPMPLNGCIYVSCYRHSGMIVYSTGSTAAD